jgi:hypothetical protein
MIVQLLSYVRMIMSHIINTIIKLAVIMACDYSNYSTTTSLFYFYATTD